MSGYNFRYITIEWAKFGKFLSVGELNPGLERCLDPDGSGDDDKLTYQPLNEQRLRHYRKVCRCGCISDLYFASGDQDGHGLTVAVTLQWMLTMNTKQFFEQEEHMRTLESNIMRTSSYLLYNLM